LPTNRIPIVQKMATSIQALFTIKIQEVSLEMQSVLLWQTNHYKKMHNI